MKISKLGNDELIANDTFLKGKFFLLLQVVKLDCLAQLGWQSSLYSWSKFTLMSSCFGFTGQSLLL